MDHRNYGSLNLDIFSYATCVTSEQSFPILSKKIAMTEFFTLSETQQRLLDACKAKAAYPSLFLFSLAREHSVPFSPLQGACKWPATEREIVRPSAGRGRKCRLDEAAEKIIAETVLEFQSCGTPLDRSCMLDLARTYVKTLPNSIRERLDFKDDRPGRAWLSGFMERHSNLKLRASNELE